MKIITTTKRWPSAPKGLRAILDDPRVEDFSDERITGDGYWIYLAPGNCSKSMGCHTIHEASVKDVRAIWDGGKDIEKCEPGCDCGWDRAKEVR